MKTHDEIPDLIAKEVILRAPLSRVWRAVSDAKEFGIWFGVEFDGPFVAGQSMRGKIVPTQVDEEVAKKQEPHAGKPFDWTVERIEPQSLISFRWHPFAIDENVDYSQEPTTLVVFQLEQVEQGTRLRITESGFSKIPLERRAKAFTANEDGWAHQVQLIEKYLVARDAR